MRILPEEILSPFLSEGCRVISVVGSGGKTTFIRKAALYYAKYFQVGVATSTKMYLPDQLWQYGGILPPVLTPDCRGSAVEKAAPICFYTEHILASGKIWDIGEEMLSRAMERSRLLLIESDGSNQKPLKGWRMDEPVILPETEVTIGILPLHCLGHRITDEMVHRMEAFSAVTGLGKDDIMTEEAYIQLISHENGLFKHARGHKILILNRADNDKLYEAGARIGLAVLQSGKTDGWRAGCLDISSGDAVFCEDRNMVGGGCNEDNSDCTGIRSV